MPAMQITTRIGCRNACSYCPQDVLVSAYKVRSEEYTMSFQTFRNCLDRIPPHVEIWFAGMCEPWLNAHCTEMLLYAASRSYRIGVMTTLVGMKLTDIQRLGSVPFLFFTVHLPSARKTEGINVDNEYLALVETLIESEIPATFHFHGGSLHPELKKGLKAVGQKFRTRSIYRRAGNIMLQHRIKLSTKLGAIRCKRNSRNNVLLPNGDVILCSNDFAMRHNLGNLLDSDYASLFDGREYRRVLEGQRDDSIDILCRYCENFSYNADFAAKLKNWRYHVDRYFYYLRDIRRPSDLLPLADKFIDGAAKQLPDSKSTRFRTGPRE